MIFQFSIIVIGKNVDNGEFISSFLSNNRNQGAVILLVSGCVERLGRAQEIIGIETKAKKAWSRLEGSGVVHKRPDCAQTNVWCY